MRRVGMALIVSALSATAMLGVANTASAAGLTVKVYGYGKTPQDAQADLQANFVDTCPNGGTLQREKLGGTIHIMGQTVTPRVTNCVK